MTEHHPANHGSDSTNSFMNPSIAINFQPFPSGIAAASSPGKPKLFLDKPSWEQEKLIGSFPVISGFWAYDDAREEMQFMQPFFCLR